MVWLVRMDIISDHGQSEQNIYMLFASKLKIFQMYFMSKTISVRIYLSIIFLLVYISNYGDKHTHTHSQSASWCCVFGKWLFKIKAIAIAVVKLVEIVDVQLLHRSFCIELVAKTNEI